MSDHHSIQKLETETVTIYFLDERQERTELRNLLSLEENVLKMRVHESPEKIIHAKRLESIFQEVVLEHLSLFDWMRICSNPAACPLLEKLFAIHGDKYDWNCLSGNPNAITLLERNSDKIDWSILSKNPNAIHLLEANQGRIDWYHLSSNPNAIALLERNKQNICWVSMLMNPNPEAFDMFKKYIFGRGKCKRKREDFIKSNDDMVGKKELWRRFLNKNPAPNVIKFLEENEDWIYWYHLSENPAAIHILEANQEMVCWSKLSKNPNAIELLERNTDKIDWRAFCASNTTERGFELMRKNPENIHWGELSSNPFALDLLRENLHMVCGNMIYSNPNPELWNGQVNMK